MKKYKYRHELKFRISDASAEVLKQKLSLILSKDKNAYYEDGSYLIKSLYFDDRDSTRLVELAELENQVDNMKRDLTAKHYARLAEGTCTVDHSPYYTSMVVGLERVADHLINVGYSILNPTGSQSESLAK